jgi:hypothetical protein
MRFSTVLCRCYLLMLPPPAAGRPCGWPGGGLAAEGDAQQSMRLKREARGRWTRSRASARWPFSCRNPSGPTAPFFTAVRFTLDTKRLGAPLADATPMRRLHAPRAFQSLPPRATRHRLSTFVRRRAVSSARAPYLLGSFQRRVTACFYAAFILLAMLFLV